MKVPHLLIILAVLAAAYYIVFVKKMVPGIGGN